VREENGFSVAPEGDYLTLQELASWLKISRGSAWSLVMEKREIPHLRLSDRVVRLARADVEAYLARCRSDAV
jgi:excisionase family DNA binding protein